MERPILRDDRGNGSVKSIFLEGGLHLRHTRLDYYEDLEAIRFAQQAPEHDRPADGEPIFTLSFLFLTPVSLSLTKPLTQAALCSGYPNKIFLTSNNNRLLARAPEGMLSHTIELLFSREWLYTNLSGMEEKIEAITAVLTDEDRSSKEKVQSKEKIQAEEKTQPKGMIQGKEKVQGEEKMSGKGVAQEEARVQGTGMVQTAGKEMTTQPEEDHLLREIAFELAKPRFNLLALRSKALSLLANLISRLPEPGKPSASGRSSVPDAFPVPSRETYYMQTIRQVEQRLVQGLQDMLPSQKQLAREFALSESTLKRHFKAIYGKTMYEYYLEKKMDLAKTLLQEKRISVSETAYRLGYGKVSAFIIIFKKYHKVLPGSLK